MARRRQLFDANNFVDIPDSDISSNSPLYNTASTPHRIGRHPRIENDRTILKPASCVLTRADLIIRANSTPSSPWLPVTPQPQPVALRSPHTPSASSYPPDISLTPTTTARCTKSEARKLSINSYNLLTEQFNLNER